MFNCENVCGNKRKTEDLPFQGVSCFNCKPEVMYLISIFFSLFFISFIFFLGRLTVNAPCSTFASIFSLSIFSGKIIVC